MAEREAASRPFGPLGDLKFGREPVCQPAFLVTATAAYGASRPLPSVRAEVPSPNPERTLALGTRACAGLLTSIVLTGIG